MAAMAIFGFVTAATITFSRGWPALPAIHDEFSYLLAADTFVRGRLTNPTPPFAEHFETFHVLMQPSYASKYPPAQAAFLALGQGLTGEPIVGVWISIAVLATALTWMLLGWFRLKWALFGASLVVLMLAAGHGPGPGYWMSTYWGGGVTATGGALLYGSVRRLTLTPSPLNGVLFALGLAILALSRPFEGALVAIPALVVAGKWLLTDRETALGWRLGRVVAPFAAVAALTLGFMLTYNARVTGDALQMPYMEHERQYSNVPIWIFERKNNTHLVNHPTAEFTRYYENYQETSPWRSVRAFAKSELDRVVDIKRFLTPGLTLILLVAALTAGMGRSLLLPLTGSAIVLLGSLGTSWYFPHYIAPMIAPWTILLTAGAYGLWRLNKDRQRTGPVLVSVIFGAVAVSALLAPVRLITERNSEYSRWYMTRDSVERALEQKGGKHIVLVQYGPEHNFDEEWVYNGANIEEAPVIWARSLTPEKNARFMEYFGDRTVWEARVDVDSLKSFTLRGADRGYYQTVMRNARARRTTHAAAGAVDLRQPPQAAPNGH